MSVDYTKSSQLLKQAYFAYKKSTTKPVSASNFAAGWNAAVWAKASK
jgi:hypothetical protein